MTTGTFPMTLSTVMCEMFALNLRAGSVWANFGAARVVFPTRRLALRRPPRLV